MSKVLAHGKALRMPMLRRGPRLRSRRLQPWLADSAELRYAGTMRSGVLRQDDRWATLVTIKARERAGLKTTDATKTSELYPPTNSELCHHRVHHQQSTSVAPTRLINSHPCCTVAAHRPRKAKPAQGHNSNLYAMRNFVKRKPRHARLSRLITYPCSVHISSFLGSHSDIDATATVRDTAPWQAGP